MIDFYCANGKMVKKGNFLGLKSIAPTWKKFYIAPSKKNLSVCMLLLFSHIGEISPKWENIFLMYFSLSTLSFLIVALFKICSGFRQRISHRKTL